MVIKANKTKRTVVKPKPKPVIPKPIVPDPTPEEELSTIRTRQKAHNLSLRGK